MLYTCCIHVVYMLYTCCIHVEYMCSSVILSVIRCNNYVFFSPEKLDFILVFTYKHTSVHSTQNLDYIYSDNELSDLNILRFHKDWDYKLSPMQLLMVKTKNCKDNMSLIRTGV